LNLKLDATSAARNRFKYGCPNNDVDFQVQMLLALMVTSGIKKSV